MSPFIYPRISPSKFRAWNEDMFVRYNNERVYLHPNPIIRFVERRRVNTLLDFLRPFSTSDRILAAGCGEGYIEHLIPSGHITFVDISREAIKRARQKPYLTPHTRFLVADLEKLPFPARSYNKIECSEVIEHVLNPSRMLSEFHRVLIPSGILVVSFPNEPLINFFKHLLIRLHLFHRFFPNVPADMTEEWHLRPLSLSMFKSFTHPQWQIVSVKAAPFWFLPIRYIVCCRPARPT